MREFDLSAVSVLLVEQSPFMQRLLGSILRELGIRKLRRAVSATEAGNSFRDAPADLILTDWAPNLDALKFLREVRASADSPNPFVPIIVVSAHTEARHVLRARDSGMTEYLAKPVSARSIYGRICSVIEHNRPFVRAPQYFGPDRRRRNSEFTGDDKRRQDPVLVEEKDMETPTTVETSAAEPGLGGWLEDAKSALSQ